MTEQPPHCPNPRCSHHRRSRTPPPLHGDGEPFFRRKGSFRRHGDHRVIRYQCKACNRHFSDQTFAEDYREKRPELTAAVARLILAGYSQRESAKLLGINRKTVSRRARRLRSGHPPRLARALRPGRVAAERARPAPPVQG